jgi:hypothetical protein
MKKSWKFFSAPAIIFICSALCSLITFRRVAHIRKFINLRLCNAHPSVEPDIVQLLHSV